MRSFFKGFFIYCAPCGKKQIAPKNSTSPPAPLSPRNVLNRAQSTPRKRSEPLTQVKLARNLSQKSEFDQFIAGHGEKPIDRDLRRATSVDRTTMAGVRSYRASAFAKSRTMSSNDTRKRDFRIDSSSKLQRSSSRSHQPIIFSTSNGLMKPHHMEMKLECTLDDLCFGCIKQIKVSRDIIHNGLMTNEDELLTVNVEPGWKKGTIITFYGEEDREAEKYSCDVIFVVVEMKHETFMRRFDSEEDLEIQIGLPLVDALAGCKLRIPLLGGEQMAIAIDEIVQPGFERVIKGQGMPRLKDLSQRGDLKIKFNLEFPKSLTDSQKSEILEILGD